MKHALALLTITAVSLLAATLSEDEEAATAEINTVCLVRHLDEIDIPARRDGDIGSLLVRRGTAVSAGQLVAEQSRADAEAQLAVAQAKLEQAKTKAANTWAIKIAETSVARSTTEAKLVTELGSDAAFLERFRAENSKARADAELNDAKATNQEDQLASQVAYSEMLVAKRDVSERQIFSPVSGTVGEVHRHQGEWVKAGEKVMTIVRLDTLLVEGFVNISDIPPHRVIGSPVKATIEISGQEPIVLDGLQISHASATTELDGKYLVWTQVKNSMRPDLSGKPQWVLRPGMSGTLTLTIPAPPAKQNDADQR